MAAGADSIDDLGILRHGAMPTVFAGLSAPSTLGAFLRTFPRGHALQLHAVNRRLIVDLAAPIWRLPPGSEPSPGPTRPSRVDPLADQRGTG
jgi:hypothetical protein